MFHQEALGETIKMLHDTVKAHSLEVLPHAAYSPKLAPSHYHLFASMGHALAE